MSTHTNPNLDPTLRDLERSLDSLGAVERAAAPESLDDAILRTSRPALSAKVHRPSVVARIFGASPALRLAAVIALVVVGAFAVTTVVRTPAPAGSFAAVEAQLDALLDAESPGTATTTTAQTSLVLGDALIDIRASVAAAEQSLDDFWSVPDDTDPLATTLETTL